MSDRIEVVLDVRPYHERGEEPFGEIMRTVNQLPEGADFILINSFEPKPLYRLLALRGFDHEATQIDGSTWRIRFYRTGRPGVAGWGRRLRSLLRGGSGNSGGGGAADDASSGAGACAAAGDVDGGEHEGSGGEHEGSGGEQAVHLDNRGLQPPQPMLRILAAADRLAPGGVIIAHNDRAPVYLYPELEARGLQWETELQPDGSAIIRIRRPRSEASGE